MYYAGRINKTYRVTGWHSVLEAPERSKLIVHCNVIYPDSGGVLALPDDVFVLPHPVAKHILTVAKDHPESYAVILDEHNNPNIWEGPGPIIPVEV